MYNVAGHRGTFFVFPVVVYVLVTFMAFGTNAFTFVPYAATKEVIQPSPEAVRVFREGLSSGGTRSKRDGGFSFGGGESGGISNLLFASLLQQMAAASPPAAAAAPPAAGGEAAAPASPAAPAPAAPSLASLLPFLLLGRGGFGCGGDDDANATAMGQPELTATIPNKALSSGAPLSNAGPARSAEPAVSIAPKTLLIQLQMNPGKGDPQDQKNKNRASSNSTTFDIQVSQQKRN